MRRTGWTPTSAAIAILLSLLAVSPCVAAQVWTDGNGDGLPDASPISAPAEGDVTVDVWVDSEGFSWTNFQATVGFEQPCLQFVEAEYIIPGGATFPPDPFSEPGSVILVGFGFSETGVEQLASITLHRDSTSPCCVTPLIDPEETSAPSALGDGETFQQFAQAFGTCYETPTEGPGEIEGHVTAGCPIAGTPLLGVRVDVFDTLGVLVASSVTDDAGFYNVGDLDPGSYTTTVVTPLGYQAVSEDVDAELSAGQTLTIDFAMNCIAIVSNPRASGFWKHQVGVATGGNGQAQIPGATLCDYLDLVAEHFNGNPINPVVVYDPPLSGLCADKLDAAKVLLNLKGSAAMVDRARQQLMALLLNVAAGNLSQTAIASLDGATISQAITYCDQLIDNPTGSHVTAKDICESINNNQQVAAGVIPLTTEEIAYKMGVGGQSVQLEQNSPNPFREATTIALALPAGTDYTLTIYNAAGQRVRQYAGTGRTSPVSISWDGNNDAGTAVAAGSYVYQLRAGSVVQARRMVLVN